MTHIRQRSLAAAIFAIAILVAAGCDRQQAQTAGQSVDRAADTAGKKLDRVGDQVGTAAKDAAAKTESIVDEAALTAKVKAALFAEPGLKTLQIDVETHGTVVTLAGTVDSDVLRKRAVQIASAMSGVSQVIDKLVVKA